MKRRAVIFGSGGFVGCAISHQMKAAGYEVIDVTRKECNLMADECVEAISKLVADGDVVVCAAAKAPAKNWDMLQENIAMITHTVMGLKGKKLAYLLNISSDAVYADSMDELNESSLIAPLSPHGIMHCMREYILEKNISCRIGHLRPTLIYGEGDPHNGYGPNSFIRSGLRQKKIELFGNGEERRDHVFIGDVATLATAMIEHSHEGVINAVTGNVISFMEIAKLVVAAGKGIELTSKPRSGSMPHNGYRAFNNDAARNLCPTLRFRQMSEHVRDMMDERKNAA